MPFQRRFQEIINKTPKHPDLKFWLNAGAFGIAIFVIVSWYLFIYDHGQYDIFTANRSAATTAFILIGFSFILSGICYFWDFLDTKIIYRKYLGITGFTFGLIHALLSSYFYIFVWSGDYGTTDFFYQWQVFGFPISNIVAFAFGLVALLIFIMMASISNRYAARELGGIWWRRLLRVGYLAYVFVLFHFTIKRADLWVAWIRNPEGLPPTSLWLLLLAFAVLGMRVALQIALMRKKLQAPEPNPVSPTLMTQSVKSNTEGQKNTPGPTPGV